MSSRQSEQETRELRRPTRTPLIALVYRANRELQSDMVRAARSWGHDWAKPAHNSVFGTLPLEGARTADLAAKAGITRQSMGEVVRELVDYGILEMRPDPADGRAKIVTYTERGLAQIREGGAHIADFEDRMVAELGEEVYEHLRLGLERVSQVLERDALEADGSDPAPAP